jgi:pimeloyl-ACP methyl ester carboxylesterase
LNKFTTCFIACLTCIISACSGSSGSPARPFGNDPAAISGSGESCQEFIKALPSDYFYGWIDVPENYEAPSSSVQIKIFYYGPKGNFASRVAFFNGGPGSDSHYNYLLFQKSFKDFSLPDGKLGFVYIDQRGNGCSSPYPEVAKEADLDRLRFYGSTGIVYDAEAVRKTLVGVQKWKIFGQSFGAFIVHRYVMLFPGSVSQAYAHANTIDRDPLQRLTERIYSQYRVFEMYFQAYPEDRARISNLATYFSDKSKCIKGKAFSYCGMAIPELLIGRLGFSNRWPGIHSRLEKMAPAGYIDSAAMQNFVNTYGSPSLIPKNYTYAMEVIGLYDRSVVPSNYTNCSAVYSNILLKYGISQSQILLSECSPSMQSKTDSKSYATVETYFAHTYFGKLDTLTLEAFIPSLKTLGTGNFYLYSGERDTFVPKANFSDEVAQTAGLLTYRHFPNSGHEGFYTEKQVFQDLFSGL